MGVCGVYTIKSPYGGTYIGGTVNYKNRWTYHRWALKFGTHENERLQRAYDKYGLNNLKFSILFLCRPKDVLFFEQRTIKILKPRYNITVVANTPSGFGHAQQTKKKLSDSKKGKRPNYPDGWLDRLRARMTGNNYASGRIQSLKERRARSLANKGKKHKDGFEANITRGQIKVIVSSYLAGDGIHTIAKRYHADAKAVRRLLLANGVSSMPPGGAGSSKFPAWRSKVITNLQDSGLI